MAASVLSSRKVAAGTARNVDGASDHGIILSDREKKLIDLLRDVEQQAFFGTVTLHLKAGVVERVETTQSVLFKDL